MADHSSQELIALLSHGEARLRMLALHMLSESYADEPEMLDTILGGWQTWGADDAYPEFPMLSHLPIATNRIDTCCQIAVEMASGKPLTSKATRCAGKLMEQVVRLPAAELKPFAETIRQTTTTSKIFFRVHLDSLQERIELLDQPADDLAGQLDQAIARLGEVPDDKSATQSGANALEALRVCHPDYMHLAGVLATAPADSGPSAASFQLTMASLAALPQAGLESDLARHLLDERESIHVQAVEALVRSRSRAAGEMLAMQFPAAAPGNRRWIARGLQRLRCEGLSESIAQLREQTQDPTLWLMLLIAEIRQFEDTSISRLATEMDRVASYSDALIDAASLFNNVHEHGPELEPFQTSTLNYLHRTTKLLREVANATKAKVKAKSKRNKPGRESAREAALDRYRRRF